MAEQFRPPRSEVRRGSFGNPWGSAVFDSTSAATPWNANTAAGIGLPGWAPSTWSEVSRPDQEMTTWPRQKPTFRCACLGGQGPPPESVPAPAFLCSSRGSSSSRSDGEISTSASSVTDVQHVQSLMVGQPSVGALLHSQGTCLPCRFHKQPEGCKAGVRCLYCHHHTHEEWSLSKTVKCFRSYVAEYRANYGASLEGIARLL
eukprot:TRINITY_DN20512_c0_g1_i1.p1 TRINITY_DN20512_c0_g1~~TRINITY_DN20512_c0_g1_i1.p1  ORF type:complete len:203 (+),score=11.57 TRINITY_DN20512_c0_g1_i1:65-673(+)